MTDNAYTQITERIIALLEQGTVPWRRTWRDDEAPQNPFTPTRYRGINAWLLIAALEESSWDDPRFATFKQIKDAGGYIRKGERGTRILTYIPVFEESSKDLPPEEREIKYLRPIAHVVFNIAAQSEGVELEPLTVDKTLFDPLERCEALVAGYPNRPPITHDGRGQAYYRKDTDSVHMPRRETFTSPATYYAALFHELVHSTGHVSRLARDGIIAYVKFGSKAYAREELIAEMGASMLCSDAGIDNQTITNSAAYIANWLAALKDDKTLVIIAAAQASRAVQHMQRHPVDA